MTAACRWNGTTNPRTLPGRHGDGCDGDGCAGCLPCTEPHCRVCGRTHAAGTCAECLAETRANLHDIARMCDALPAEVEHRGVEGEAMMLLGPTADPEARGHLEASVLAGRIPPDYLAEAHGQLHPLFCLGTWDMIWRDALEHDDIEVLTLAGTVDYLDRTMSYMAGYEHVPFEDFARDLRQCASHLEAVLHDGEQVDRTRVPCLKCGTLLERRFGIQAALDGHVCPKCKRTYDDEEFRLAKADWLSREEAERYVLIADAAQAIDRSEHTLRTWMKRDKVRSMCDRLTHRLHVWWPDVRDQEREAKVRELRRKAS